MVELPFVVFFKDTIFGGGEGGGNKLKNIPRSFLNLLFIGVFIYLWGLPFADGSAAALPDPTSQYTLIVAFGGLKMDIKANIWELKT